MTDQTPGIALPQEHRGRKPRRRAKVLEAHEARRKDQHGKNEARPGNRAAIREDAAVLARQERAFDLRVVGYPLAQIAVALEVTRQTVAADLRHETARRMDENAPDRAHKAGLQVARYEKIIAQAALLIAEHCAHAKEALEAERPGVAVAFFRVAALERRNILAALKSIDLIEGLQAPVKLEVQADGATQAMLDVVGTMTMEQRRELRERAAEFRVKHVAVAANGVAHTA